jgi:hypothetical protein
MARSIFLCGSVETRICRLSGNLSHTGSNRNANYATPAGSAFTFTRAESALQPT